MVYFIYPRGRFDHRNQTNRQHNSFGEVPFANKCLAQTKPPFFKNKDLTGIGNFFSVLNIGKTFSIKSLP